MKITDNFSYSEFLVSDSFPELAAKIELTELDKLKLFYMCKIHLQPIRDYFGPVVILSGKRSPELNTKVGGSPTSDHLYLGESCAVDFTLPKVEVEVVFNYICLNSDAFGQCIYYPDQNFIHLSLPTRKHQGESWIMRKAA